MHASAIKLTNFAIKTTTPFYVFAETRLKNKPPPSKKPQPPEPKKRISPRGLIRVFRVFRVLIIISWRPRESRCLLFPNKFQEYDLVSVCCVVVSFFDIYYLIIIFYLWREKTQYVVPPVFVFRLLLPVPVVSQPPEPKKRISPRGLIRIFRVFRVLFIIIWRPRTLFFFISNFYLSNSRRFLPKNKKPPSRFLAEN